MQKESQNKENQKTKSDFVILMSATIALLNRIRPEVVNAIDSTKALLSTTSMIPVEDDPTKDYMYAKVDTLKYMQIVK